MRATSLCTNIFKGFQAMNRVFHLLLVGAMAVTLGCSEDTKQATEMTPADLVKRGAGVYAANCTVCHNPNPSLDGGLGPALVGSSLELITMRVLRVQYPAGYTPKRDTSIMLPLPYLEPELPALAAFLNSK
jgi:mono/diheme cytochrome c family protein